MKTQIAGVYSIRNKMNNKVYVGRSVDVINRLNTHIRSLVSGKHSCLPLRLDYYIYGPEAFEFNIEKIIYKGEVTRENNSILKKQLDVEESKIGIQLGADFAKTGYNFLSKFTKQERDLSKVEISPDIELFIKDNIGEEAINIYKSVKVHYDIVIGCSMICFTTLKNETGLDKRKINKYLKQFKKHKILCLYEYKYNNFSLFYPFKKIHCEENLVVKYINDILKQTLETLKAKSTNSEELPK